MARSIGRRWGKVYEFALSQDDRTLEIAEAGSIWIKTL